MSSSFDPVEKTIQAARDGGACCPEAVAELLRPKLVTEQRGATTCVYAHTPEGTVPVEAAIARLRETPRLARLFSPDGKLDLRDMPHEEFLAIRKTNPEIFGLGRR